MKKILLIVLLLLSSPALATPPICDPEDRVPFYGNLVWGPSGPWRVYDLDSEHAYYNISSVSTSNLSGTTAGSNVNDYVQVNHPCGTYIGTPGLQEDNAYADENILYGASIDKCWFKINFWQAGAAVSPNTAGAISNSNIPLDGWTCGPVVTDEEQAAYTTTLSTNEDVWSGYNLRVRIPAAKITNTPAGTPTYTNLVYNGCTTEPLIISSATICHAAASGDAYDCAATPVNVGSATVPQSGTLKSSNSAFVWNKTSDVVANFYFNGGSSNDCIRRRDATGSGSVYYKVGSDETGTANVTGYSGSSSNPNVTAVFSEIRMDGY